MDERPACKGSLGVVEPSGLAMILVAQFPKHASRRSSVRPCVLASLQPCCLPAGRLHGCQVSVEGTDLTFFPALPRTHLWEGPVAGLTASSSCSEAWGCHTSAHTSFCHSFSMPVHFSSSRHRQETVLCDSWPTAKLILHTDIP